MYVIIVEMLRVQRTCGGFPIVFNFSDLLTACSSIKLLVPLQLLQI